ncbi:MAG: TldD/PmbA family protein [Bacilli bacterium]
MISKNLALQVLNAGLTTGADFVEIFLEEKPTLALQVENGLVKEIDSALTYGAGIRLLKGVQSVYGSTNDLSKKGLLKLASQLSASFVGTPVKTVEKIKRKRSRNYYPAEKPLAEVPMEEKIALMKECSNLMLEYDPSIKIARVFFAESEQKVTIFNSDGWQFEDLRPRLRMFFLPIAVGPNGMETAGEGPGAMGGWEFFTDIHDAKKTALKTAEQAVRTLNAKECPSGKMPVVIGNGFGGVIFHEACGHSLEASSVSKGLSVFAGKLGEQIASPVVTAIDDGTIEKGWGSINIDDEGIPSQKKVLIKDGVLQNYMIDLLSGRRMNAAPNGASRRQSYRFEPTSRMTNTYIANGKSTPEEIIASVKLGLYAKSLGGGSVNPTTGEFNFACSEAYIIRDGRVCEPVKGASLVGSGAEILKNITMVGNDLRRSQGMCGAASGNIPTDVGQPTILVSEITVGGRGGKLE